MKPNDQENNSACNHPQQDNNPQDNNKAWADELNMPYTPPEEQPGTQSGQPLPDAFQTQPSNPQDNPDTRGECQTELSQHSEPMPPTYLVWAIISTVCCCLPAGIAAIVFASSVSSKYYARDYDGARNASRQAEIWIIIAIVAGILFNSLYLPLAILSGL